MQTKFFCKTGVLRRSLIWGGRVEVRPTLGVSAEALLALKKTARKTTLNVCSNI